MYHYCRSLLCDQPFAGGTENLSLLFDKNAKMFEQISSVSKERLYAASMVATNPNEKRKKELEVKMKIFLISFVRLHGGLFAWTKDVKHSLQAFFEKYSREDSAVALDFAEVAPIDLDSWDSIFRSLLNDFDDLLISNSFGDYLLVRLMAICIFSVHHSSVTDLLSPHSDAAIGSQVNVSKDFLSQYRSSAESLALVFLFGIVNKYVSYASLLFEFQSN